MTVLLAAWLVRITAFVPGTDWPASAAIGAVPGLGVSAAVAAFFLAAAAIAFRPRTWKANGELRLTDVDVWGDAEQ